MSTLLQKRKIGTLETLENYERPVPSQTIKRDSDFSILIKGASHEDSKQLIEIIESFTRKKITDSMKPSKKITVWNKLLSLVFRGLSRNDLVESTLFEMIIMELLDTKSLIYRNNLVSILIKIVKMNSRVLNSSHLELIAKFAVTLSSEDQNPLIDLSNKFFKTITHSKDLEFIQSQRLVIRMFELYDNATVTFEQKIKFFKVLNYTEKKEYSNPFLNQLINIYPNEFLKLITMDEKFFTKLLDNIITQENNENSLEMLLSFLLKSRGKDDVQSQIQVLMLIGKILASGLDFKRLQNKSDNMFVYICELCWNFSLHIRREATKQLELFYSENEELALQTIRKQCLSDYQKKEDDKMIETTDIDLMQSRENKKEIYDDKVIGVLIHLLEDEFSEIRVSALRIIRNFGSNFQQFANDSREILFDMLNDDSDNVRFEALKVLSELHKNLNIKPNELESIMYNIKEDSFQLRLIIYKFLENVRLRNSTDAILIFNVIILNLEKFKADCQAVYKCLRHLAVNNHDHFLGQIKTILNIDERFLVQEPDWRNSLHVGRMILVSNALRFQKNIMAELPFYFNKHRDYLSDLYPEYFGDESITKSSQKVKAFQSLIKDRCSYLFKPLQQTIPKKVDELSTEENRSTLNFKEVFLRLMAGALKGLSEDEPEASLKNLKECKNLTKIYKLKKESQDQDQFKLRFLHLIAKFFLSSIKQRNKLKIQASRLNFLQDIDIGERPVGLIKKGKISLNIRFILRGLQKLQSLYRQKGKKLNFLINLIKLYNVLTYILSFSLNSLTSVFENNQFLDLLETMLNIKAEMESKLQKSGLGEEISSKVLELANLMRDFSSKVLSNPDRLKKFESRKLINEDFKLLSNALSSTFSSFSMKESELLPILLQYQKATIIEPSPKKDESIEISNRHLAPISITLVLSKFKEIDILNSAIQFEYQNNSREYYKIGRDDIVYKEKGDTETTINIKYFLEKVSWRTETKLSLRCVDVRPLWIFSKGCCLNFINSEVDITEIINNTGKILDQGKKLVAYSKKTHISLKQKYYTK